MSKKRLDLDEIKKCTHMNKDGSEHFFEFEFHAGRNLYNPFQPICTKCGARIGEIIQLHLPYVLIILDHVQDTLKNSAKLLTATKELFAAFPMDLEDGQEQKFHIPGYLLKNLEESIKLTEEAATKGASDGEGKKES